MENHTTLEQINELLKTVNNEGQAVAYGIQIEEGGLQYSPIAKGLDVYELIEDLSELVISRSYDYLAIETWGWAAPLNKVEEEDIAPSKHAERRRVKLIIAGSNKEKGIIGSALCFSDAVDEPVFDYGDATGSLADAFSDFFGGK
jgi:hypothetical protein